MMVLSRKKGEGLVIGDCINVVVIEIRGDRVRLGIDAPREIPVHTQENYDRIRSEAPLSFERKVPAKTKTATITLSPDQLEFVDSIVTQIGGRVGRNEVVSILLDTVAKMGINLQEITSIENLRNVVLGSAKSSVERQS